MTDLNAAEGYRQDFIQMIQSAQFTLEHKMVKEEVWLKQVLSFFVKLIKQKKNLFIVGNGASFTMAAHLAVDMTKNVGLKSFSFSDGALLTCLSNDFSYETALQKALQYYMSDGDGLMAISSSGRSANILNAVSFVREHHTHSKILSFSGFTPDNPLRNRGHLNLYIEMMEYGRVESGHAFFLHMLCDLLTKEVYG